MPQCDRDCLLERGRHARHTGHVGSFGVSLQKTSFNGNTRFRTDEIYETLIELVEVSGLAKAFLHNRLGIGGRPLFLRDFHRQK